MNRPLSELAEIIRLQKGAHKRPQDGVCVNELTAWIAGEKHSDAPECASPVVARFLMGLNDQMPDDWRQKLAPYALRQIGTRGTLEQEQERAYMCADWAVRVIAPMALRAYGRAADAKRLVALPPICDVQTAEQAKTAAYAYAAAHANAIARATSPLLIAAANSATNAAATAATNSAAYAAYAYAAAYAATTAAAYAATTAADAATNAAVWQSALDLVDRLIAVTGSSITTEVEQRAELLRDRVALVTAGDRG